MTADELVKTSPCWDGTDEYYDRLLEMAEDYIDIADKPSRNGFYRYLKNYNHGSYFLDELSEKLGYKKVKIRTTPIDRIAVLEKLLTFKGERYNSDQHIHLGLCIEHLYYGRELHYQRSLFEAWEHTDKSLEHIRLSYTASRESGEECELERIVPEGLEINPLSECWSHPCYPYLVEADVWCEKARLCVDSKNWIEAYYYILHAENFVKITKREFYSDVLCLSVNPHFVDEIQGDADEEILYNWIIQEKEKILKHIEPSEFNKNTPSDDFLLEYTWCFDPEEDVEPIVEHWQNMIMRCDFHIFSEQQCYLILLEFYFFYWYQIDWTRKKGLLEIILDCIDKAICASPINTDKTDDTLLDPWVIHTDDGRIINAYKKPESVEHMEVCYWAWKADYLSNPVYNSERESLFARMHAEFLDRIYFLDTKDYALKCYYFTPNDLVEVYKNSINRDCSLDLLRYAKGLLDINPAAKLRDFVDYVQLRSGEGDEPLYFKDFLNGYGR